MSPKTKLIRFVEYLHSSPEGDIDIEKSKQLFTELAKAKRSLADYDIIIDFRRAIIKLTISDIWYLAAEFLKHGISFHDKLAVLVLPSLNFDKAEFFKLCSKNRGYNVDVFTNYEDALHWFSEKGSAGS